MWQPTSAVIYQSKQEDIKLHRLLLVLADKADKDGRLDPAPSQDTLAALFDVSDRTIRNWINDLLASGELTRTRRGRGEGNPSAYQINLPMPGSDEVTGSYGEAKPGNVSGNYEEKLEERLRNLEEKISQILPVIANLQEIEERLTGITGKVNRKALSTKSDADPIFDPYLDPEEEGIPPHPPFAFKPSPVKPANNSPADKRVAEILLACHMSADIPGHLARAELAAAQIKNVSAGYIRDRYTVQGHINGSWNWYQDDWRGKKGEVPTPEGVIETIYRERPKALSPPGGKMTKAEQELAEYEQMKQESFYE